MGAAELVNKSLGARKHQNEELILSVAAAIDKTAIQTDVEQINTRQNEWGGGGG